MKKSYKLLFNLTSYGVALIAIVYAVKVGLSVPVTLLLGFAGIVTLVCFLYAANESAKAQGHKIKVKYFEPNLEKIEKINVGDWIDLRAAERVEMKKGDYYLIRLGVGMILPAGYEALVLPRSSTPNKFGIMLANSCGVIDNSYSGDTDEWRFPAVALRDTVIEKGDRIAQFRILENQPRITFETVPHLKNKSRGGIGSTGKR